MSSLADLPELVGFFSYSREDDGDSGGELSALRSRIQGELRGQLGRTAKTFRLWQDKEAISSGTLWESEIKNAVKQAVFFIPIITPTVIASPYCRLELESFLAREAELGRDDLVFPILYIEVPMLADVARRQNDPVLSLLARRQYVDWSEFRYLDVSSTEVRRAVGRFCADIRNAMHRPWISPEERKQQEIAAGQLKETERQRQDSEATLLADEMAERRGEERKRRADEEAKARDEEQKRQRETERRRAEQSEADADLARRETASWSSVTENLTHQSSAEDGAAVGRNKRRHARTLNALTLVLSLVGALVAPFAKQNGGEAVVILAGGAASLLWALITFLLAIRLGIMEAAIVSTLYSALLCVIGFLIIVIFNLSASDGWQPLYVELIIGTILFGIYFLRTQFRN
jgi:TIR domain